MNSQALIRQRALRLASLMRASRALATGGYAHEQGDAPRPIVPKNVHIGWQQYHIMDPSKYTFAPEWSDAHEKQRGFYRTLPMKDSDHSRYDIKALYWVSAVTWAFIFYHLYWQPDTITGEWYLPWVEEFTDEELGIPPEGSSQPEYWGKHFDKLKKSE